MPRPSSCVSNDDDDDVSPTPGGKTTHDVKKRRMVAVAIRVGRIDVFIFRGSRVTAGQQTTNGKARREKCLIKFNIVQSLLP